jgi:hypothetical protein
MPDFEQWILVVKKNNSKLFIAEKIQITPTSLERQLETAFWEGFKYCEELEKLKKDAKADSKGDFNDIFGSLFGKK